ncbi:uncharacterized protein LOC112006826 isoform X3 [Quercus suber]|uniref:uncharacterized protein LOC112006826 isoform X3 n=1 Tax=Quercus suber TaxID=58331 RepID=UPI0032DEBC0E
MLCPETSAPSPSKIQSEVNSALPTSSKRRRLVSEVWNDFKRVEVDGEHRAICNHCLKHFSGSSKSGTTHLKNHLSRCSAVQSGESSKRRRLVSKVWNDFKRVEVDGKCRALCTHCHKHFSGSSKSGTTHLKNHLSRCAAIKSPTLWRMAIPKSTSTSNSAFGIETTTINPILNGCDPDIVEALVCGKEWLENPIRFTSNKDNECSPELTYTSFFSAGASLSLETQEKHAPSSANMELMLTNHRVDSEHSPEITQNSFVFPWASLSFEPQQKHAPSSANTELMVANPSSTSYPEPGPTSHSSFVSAGTFSGLELHEKHAPSSANMELMLANLSSISCSEPLPIGHTSFVSVGASLSLESQEKLAPFSANSELMLGNHSSTSCPWPLATGHTSFVSVGTSLSLEPQEEHAPSSANSELMLANHSSTSCPEPLPTGHSSFVLEGTSLSLEIQEKHAHSSAIMELMPVNLSPTMYQNHHPPSLFDEVWKLENIGKDGALHKRLSCESIITVKDFLTLLFIDPARLQNILGTGMSAKMWEVTVEHAQTCVLEKRMFLYSPPSSQQKYGVVFNVVGQVMGLLLECQYVPIDKLSETEKADAHNLVISAFKHWEEVVSFDDEASLVGSSSLLTNVYTASLPRTESSNVSKFLATHKIGRGLDDYCLHSIDSKGLRYEQALNSQESLNHSFDDNHLNFFDTDLPTQNVNLKSQSDLQGIVDNFSPARAAIGRARMRWTKLFSTLIWFSIRVALRKQVLGTDKPAKTWEVTVECAQTCVLEKRMLLYSPPNSPDIMSSIYSVGGSSGLDDYYLPSIERASSFLESMKNSFNDNDLNPFYSDLLTQDVNSESQLDF